MLHRLFSYELKLDIGPLLHQGRFLKLASLHTFTLLHLLCLFIIEDFHAKWNQYGDLRTLSNFIKSFAECVNSVCNGIEVIYCAKEAVERDINAFEKRVFDINSISYLQQIHCIRVMKNYVISYSSVSTEEGLQFHFKETTDSKKKRVLHLLK